MGVTGKPPPRRRGATQRGRAALAVLLGLLALGAVLVAVAVFVRDARGPDTAADRRPPPARPAPAPSAASAPAPTPAPRRDAPVALGPCDRHPYFPTKVGTLRRYRATVAGSQGEITRTLMVLRRETAPGGGARLVATWQAVILVGSDDAPSVYTRVCEETPAGAVAEEFWSGHGLAVFVRVLSQSWRFPAALRVGDAFAGTTVLSVLDREVSVSRRHRVAAEERLTTGAGTFDAWRLEIDDTSEGNAPAHSRYWVAPGAGLVRAVETVADRQTLEVELEEAED
jgi:hypothetical protein